MVSENININIVCLYEITNIGSNNLELSKEKLFEFCKENNIQKSGSKEEITKRIHIYLETR